jgi:hypothetical protein
VIFQVAQLAPLDVDVRIEPLGASAIQIGDRRTS